MRRAVWSFFNIKFYIKDLTLNLQLFCFIWTKGQIFWNIFGKPCIYVCSITLFWFAVQKLCSKIRLATLGYFLATLVYFLATLGLVWFYCQHLLVWTEYGAKSWSSLVMTSRAPQREKAAMKLIAWLARIMLAFYLDLHNGANIFLKPHLNFCVLTIFINEFSKITLISLINVESRLLILKKKSTLHTHFHPPRLLIS